jgi:hypothetical protein
MSVGGPRGRVLRPRDPPPCGRAGTANEDLHLATRSVRTYGHGVRILTGGGRFVPASAGRRRALSTGMGLFLIAVGAVLLFAVPDDSPFGINLHVVGIILIVVGILGLLLPATLRGGGQPRGGLRAWINPSGVDDPAVHSNQQAAAEDEALIREDEPRFDRRGPESTSDEL